MADIFIFPTIDDAFGVVGLQAMAGSSPSNQQRGSVSEIITEGYNGFVLENPWDAKEIARKVNLLVEDEAPKKNRFEGSENHLGIVGQNRRGNYESIRRSDFD